MTQEPNDGITAKNITATNVVRGVQLDGKPDDLVLSLVDLARELRSGAIRADDIHAVNVVAGLQHISDAKSATRDDLAAEIEELQSSLRNAIAAGELRRPEADDALEAVAIAQQELTSDSPSGPRLVRKLRELADVLGQAAAASEAAGKVGAQVVKMAPLAAVIWQVAQRMVGI